MKADRQPSAARPWRRLLPPLAAALLLAPPCTDAAAVTPIEKVIELLQGMLAKAKEGKEKEVLQWTAYKQWCSDAELDRQTAVKAADLEIESLQASKEKFDMEASRLGEEIQGHEKDIVDFKAGLKNATAQRGEERDEYKKLHQDYTESVQAITEAIKVLKQQAYDRPQATTLLQGVRTLKGLPQAAGRAIEAFLAEASAQRADAAAVTAGGSGTPGEAHGYEFQSGGIVDLLEDLLDKFRGELTALEKEELINNQRYEVVAQDLTHQTDAAEHEIGKKSKAQAEATQGSADASAQLGVVSAGRADDASFLEGLKVTCNQKSDDFEARQKLREEEMEALHKAVELISGGAVAGAAKEHLPSLTQSRPRAAALLQLRSGSPQAPEARARAAAYLQRVGGRIGSRMLSLLAKQLQADSDPFAKVKKMIQELISRLQEEANNEAEHKQWCDQELGDNEQTRTTKTQEVDGLHTTIEQLESHIAILRRSIADLSEAVATLTSQMEQARKLRSEEQARNQDTIADAAGAQIALAQAVKLLKDYYGKAGAATVLLQASGAGATGKGATVQAPPPPIFDAPFQGQQTESKNILAFLEVIESDFARLESETTKSEEAAQSEFNDLIADSEADKAEKEKEIKEKSDELSGKEQDLQTAENDLDLAQSQLDAALAYYEKLKPSCVGSSSNTAFEDRVRRREEEVTALKEALDILDGETAVSAPESLYSSVDGGNRGYEVGITAGSSPPASL